MKEPVASSLHWIAAAAAPRNVDRAFVSTSLHMFALLTGAPGVFLLYAAMKALRNSALSPVGRIVVMFCVLVGVGLVGFAGYLVILSSGLPAK